MKQIWFLLVPLVCAFSSLQAEPPLIKFKFSYSPAPSTTSRTIILEADTEYHAKELFHDLLPKATIWSISQIK